MSDPLEVPPERLRELGHRVVDLVVDHLAGLRERPLNATLSRADAEAGLREPLPRSGADPEEVFRRIAEDVFAGYRPVSHPRFFAYVPGPSNGISVLADLMASAFNPFMGSWGVAPGPVELEIVTVDWLRELLGLPAPGPGLFLSGGSMANATAVAAARHAELGGDLDGAVAYAGDQAHSSVARALSLCGFRREQLVLLPADGERRLAPDALAGRIREDRRAGRRPFLVVATAGTTNTGAVDPLDALADVCGAEGLRLHVDGAYGAAAAASPRARPVLAGLARADSVSIDPHKWLFQPYECACLLVRDRRYLSDAFSVHAEYLRDVTGAEEEVNFRDYGVQLTRAFRALKVYASLKVFGADAFVEAVERGLDRAEQAEREIRARPGFEVVSPATLGIVCFRHVPAGRSDAEVDEHNRRLNARVAADGYAMVSSTELDGRPVLRLCTIHPATRPEEIRRTLDRFAALA